MTPLRDAYLAAAEPAAALLADPAVARSWDAPSALAQFPVSGLAGHLASQILSVPRALAMPVPDDEAIPLIDHYTRARWIGAALDDEINVGIRRLGEDIAAGGAAELAARAQAAVRDLREALAAEPDGRTVPVPAGPWSLSLDDFLTTRMMELAVHSDDLAVSVGVPTPDLPAAVLDPVFALLTRLAVHRHGPTALLHALSRAERAPTTVAAF